jgi:hypothetical protein
LWDGNTVRVAPPEERGHDGAVLELLALLLAAVRAAGRRRGDLIAENLLLRHQPAVLTRPTRQRRRVRFRRVDKLLWVRMRRLRHDWRRHLVLVTPDTVIRWHRAVAPRGLATVLALALTCRRPTAAQPRGA